MSIRHKACPFCGSRRRDVVDMGCEKWGQTHIIECRSCGAQGPYGFNGVGKDGSTGPQPWENETEAYAAWDKRK